MNRISTEENPPLLRATWQLVTRQLVKAFETEGGREKDKEAEGGRGKTARSSTVADKRVCDVREDATEGTK